MNKVSVMEQAPDICGSAPAHVRAIAPYQPGKPIAEVARELGLREDTIIKLASNENPLGCSAGALAAIRSCLGEVARYPDGNGFELRAALSKRYGVDQSGIALGNGSNDILDMAARAFLSPGTSAVYSQHAFAVYPLATQAAGATGIEVPARDYGHDLQAMVKAIRKDTRVVFVANPNNPTGTWIAPDEIEGFIRKVPGNVLVVLDEAYNEYLADEERGESIRLISRYPNLLVSRTFSKAYGLAGLRVGYGLAHSQVTDLLNRVRQPFNVSSIAQVAAVAALVDEDFVQRSRQVNRDGMEVLLAGFRRLGLTWIPSHANFVSFRIGDGAAAFQKLLKLGVIVRPVGSYGMPDYLRVTIGTEAENLRFLGALETILK
jgi:histidinol-phosphate aminotransferase